RPYLLNRSCFIAEQDQKYSARRQSPGAYAYTNPAIEKLIIQKPGPGHPQLRSIMPAPADSPQKPAMQQPPEESPNSAFGLS
ncbi:hypothetical protein, partial [Acetobacter sp. LMG 32666]|uniref:hypothetical protein n=1 Tax=Acetobacter sp. LMG 32666 TaxID=2959295 RepID=UPI0030C7B6FA